MTHNKSIFNGNLYVLFLVLAFFAVPVIVPQQANEHYQTMLYLMLSHLTALFLYFTVTKPTFAQLFDEFNIHPIPVGIGVLSFAMGIIIQPVMMIISGLSSFVFPNNMSKAILDYSQMPFLLLFITIAVIPAVMEEIGFRGIVLSNYKNISVKKAAVITGLLFALIHLDLQQFLYTFIIGIIFAYMVKATGSILPTIIAHMAVNGTQIFMSYSQLPSSRLPKPVEMFGALLWRFFLTNFSIIFSIVFTVCMIIYFKKKSAVVQTPEEKPREIFNFEAIAESADWGENTFMPEEVDSVFFKETDDLISQERRIEEFPPGMGEPSEFQMPSFKRVPVSEKILDWPFLAILFIYAVTVLSANLLQ